MQQLQCQPEGCDKSYEKVPQPLVVERGRIRQPKTWERWSHTRRTHHPRIPGLQCWGASKERFGLAKSKNAFTRWVKGEIDFLKANWNKIETRELSRILGKSPQSIYLKKHRLGLVRNIKVDWSKKECIAYVLGALWGDGNIEYYYSKRSVYRVVLKVKNKNFARRFFNELKNINLNPHIGRQGEGLWKVQVCSKEFVTYLKLLRISKAKEELRGERVKSAFLAGLFDAEGSVRPAKGTLQLRIFNTDRELIDLASRLSKELGFNLTRSERKLPSGKTYFTLSLCNKQNVNSFLGKISPARGV